MNRSVGAWGECDRGALVPALYRHHFTVEQACDGNPDCAALEDEAWGLNAGGGRGAPCPRSLVSVSGSVRCLGWLALLLALGTASWALRHRRAPAMRWSGWPFAAPLLLGCSLGGATAILLSSVGASGVGLVDYRQCVVPSLLLVAATLVAGSLLTRSLRVVRLAAQPLAAQMVPLQAAEILPLGVMVGLQLMASAAMAVVDPWRPRHVGVAPSGGVRCACANDGVAVAVFGAQLAVVGLLLLRGLWVALVPGWMLAKKFHFYPWMRDGGSTGFALIVVCMGAAVTGAVLLFDGDDAGGAQLPVMQTICIGFNAVVIVILPLLFGPKAAAVHDDLNGKRARVTNLHTHISSNCAPCVIDRGTGTMAQGRFRNSDSSRATSRP